MKFPLLFIFAAVLISTHVYERTWNKGNTLSYGIWTQNDELYIITFFDSTNTDAAYSKIVANNEASQQPNGASQLNHWKPARRIPKQSLLLKDRCSWSLQPKFDVQNSSFSTLINLVVTRRITKKQYQLTIRMIAKFFNSYNSNIYDVYYNNLITNTTQIMKLIDESIDSVKFFW